MIHILLLIFLSSSLFAYSESDVTSYDSVDQPTDSEDQSVSEPVDEPTNENEPTKSQEGIIASVTPEQAAINKVREQIASDDNDLIVADYQSILDAEINKQAAKELTGKELTTLDTIAQTLNAYGQQKTAAVYQEEAALLTLFLDRMSDTSDVYFTKSLAAQKKSIIEINDALTAYQQNKKAAISEVQEKYPEFLTGPAKTDNTTFINYLASLDPEFMTIPISEALYRTTRGEEFIKNQLSNAASYNQMSKAQLMDTIANVQWALYKQAIIKDPEGFTSGMIQVNDAHQYLFNLLKQAEPYSRASTHFKETRNESYGLDFDKAILPNGRKTILFGTTKNGTTFMKYEFHGFDTVSDKLSHVLDWLATRGKQESGRKEHTPEFINTIYQGLAKKAGISIDAQALKANGISYMQDSLPAAYKQEFTTILDVLGLDNSNVRKGNEIILSL